MVSAQATETPYPLPLTADGVTAAWVGAALRTRYPEVTVAGVQPLETIEGTATKVLLQVTYGAGRSAGLPARMWIKGGFAAHREYVGSTGIYAGEVRFFNQLAALYELSCPASYFGLAQAEPLQGIVALEDLRARGVAFARATSPLSVAHARAGLDALAALHRQSWHDERPRQLGVEPVLGPTTEPFIAGLYAELPRFFSTARAFAAPVALHDAERLHAAITTYRAHVQRDPACLVHADSHVGNAYVERDGRVGFVDWQTVALGPWTHDVNYFLVSALDLPDRRTHERELIAHYLTVLGRYGVQVPRFDAAWDEYRRATVYGFFSWLHNLDVWQPPEVNTATFARFAAAMLDHETYAALGV